MLKSLAMQKSRGCSWTCMAEPFRGVTGSNLVSQDVALAQIKMKASGIGPLSLLFLPQEGGGGLEKLYSEHWHSMDDRVNDIYKWMIHINEAFSVAKTILLLIASVFMSWTRWSLWILSRSGYSVILCWRGRNWLFCTDYAELLPWNKNIQYLQFWFLLKKCLFASVFGALTLASSLCMSPAACEERCCWRGVGVRADIALPQLWNGKSQEASRLLIFLTCHVCHKNSGRCKKPHVSRL